MALDASTLELTAQELSTRLVEARIDKITQPTRDEIVLAMRSRRGNLRLFISARSGSARICLTDEPFENPMVPPSFCMLLRKHFASGRFIGLRTIEGERIVFFDFACTNEMGDSVRNTLAAELMGRYSNVVLLREDGRIIDALKRVDFEDSEVRQLLPGLEYALPPKPDKLSFVKSDATGIVKAVMATDAETASALMKVAGGVGPCVCREAVYRAFGANSVAPSCMNDSEQDALASAITDIQSDYLSGGRPCIALNNGVPCEFSFTALSQYGDENLLAYDSFSQMLEAYYATKDKSERLRVKARELHKSVKNMYERSVRKLAARRDELNDSGRADKLRIYGELINANLFACQKGVKSVTLNNWYDGKDIDVPMDVRLSPSANAQKYFKDYKKKQTAANMLGKLISDGEAEVQYLESVLYEVENAEGEAALSEIRAELKAGAYLKYYKVKDKRQKPADFYRYTSSDGFSILVGRNNVQNEKLTLKTARGKDMWFHVKNAPGSHAVILSEGADIPDQSKSEAAMLAVVHSSLKAGEKVAVDYTEVKNIRKTSDLPVGMVLYDTYETAYITPDADITLRLAVQTKDTRGQ